MFLFIERKQIHCQEITQINGLNLPKSLARHATHPPRLARMAGVGCSGEASGCEICVLSNADRLSKILIYAINYNILPVTVLFLF